MNALLQPSTVIAQTIIILIVRLLTSESTQEYHLHICY